MEARISGASIDRDLLLRRFPAHENLIHTLLAEPPMAATPAPSPDPAEDCTEPTSCDVQEPAPNPEDLTPLESPDSALNLAEADSREAPAPAPAAAAASDKVLRQERADAHGVFRQWSDGTCTYTLTRSRFLGRNPASEYLARAERIASAQVPGVQTPTVLLSSTEGTTIVFREVQGAPVTMITSRLSRSGSQRKLYDVILRMASRLQALHERGAAHGRITWGSLCSDPKDGKWLLGTGLEVGPGFDGGTLQEQQLNDIRSLGAMLYIALAELGSTTTVADVVQRYAADGLVPLSGRRPGLHPGICRIVDQALGAGRNPQAFQSMAGFRTQLRRMVNLETGGTLSTANGSSGARSLRWLVLLPVFALLLWAFFPDTTKGNQARLAQSTLPSEEILRDLQTAIERQDQELAQQKLQELRSILGFSEKDSPPESPPENCADK
jgi:hypothetical protein